MSLSFCQRLLKSSVKTIFQRFSSGMDFYAMLAIELNNLGYCRSHERDVCGVCRWDGTIVNDLTGFELPENGVPQYPSLLRNIGDRELRGCIANWWLEMQRAMYPGERAPMEASRVQLPAGPVLEDVKTSAAALQAALIKPIRLVHGMATEQRYFSANQATIMLEDFDTFSEAAVLYEQELTDMMVRGSQLYELRHGRPPDQRQAYYERVNRAKASTLFAFGFFLGLNTQRCFWRAMENTAEAFVMHVESFNETADGEVVMTDKAQSSMLQWLGQVFWCLQLAQYRLNQLRVFQHERYQEGEFQFYPCRVKEALKTGLDVHLLIAKLSKAPMCDFPLVSSLFRAFGEASLLEKQMQDVNVEIMAAIDELSTRFRVMEALISAARLVATEDDIKAAILSFVFDPQGEEVNWMMDAVTAVITHVRNSETRTATPKRRSFLQMLIVKENSIFKQHSGTFLSAPTDTLVPRARFDAFKTSYSRIYHDIRQKFKEVELSLLPLDVARRYQHRRDVAKKKKKALTAEEKTKADIVDGRSVPGSTFLEPSFFWEVGDGRVEKYVPPSSREKVKTRKQQQGTDDATESNEVPRDSGSVYDDSGVAPAAVKRPLHQLKECDLITRDLLWRKRKGTLKWSSLVQFLARLGCSIISLDGSKKKVVDPYTGRCAVLHMPHPSEDCRPDQVISYRMHIEDWLQIPYAELVLDEKDNDQPVSALVREEGSPCGVSASLTPSVQVSTEAL